MADISLDDNLDFLSLFPDGVPELPTLPGDFDDFSSCSPATSSSGNGSPPMADYAVPPSVGIAVTLPSPAALPSCGKRSNDTPLNSGSSSGSGGSDADMGNSADNDISAKRAKRQERLRRNRESAAKSRQRQKERVAGMEASISELRSQVSTKDTEISRLTHENRLLRDQVAFLQGLLSKAGPVPASHLVMPGSVPPVKRPQAAAVGHTTATAGVVLMAVVFSFALCVVPGAMEGGLAQWVSGAPASSFGGSTPPLSTAHSRGILSDGPEWVQVEPLVTDTKPPVPHMWSPTAAVTFALYAMGMQNAARSVLTHVVAVAVAGACLMLAKTTWEWSGVSRPRRRASELPTAQPRGVPVASS